MLCTTYAQTAAGGGGKKGGTPAGKKDRTDKGNILTEDTSRDAVTNALRLHLHFLLIRLFSCCLARGKVKQIINELPNTCSCSERQDGIYRM
jgi:hypothetical protein